MLQLKPEINDTSEISSFQTFLLQARTLLKHVANEQAQSRETELRMVFFEKAEDGSFRNLLLWNNGSSVATSQ